MGRPKAWLPFGGERLLQRSVRIVSEVVDRVVVVASPDQELPALPAEITVVRDAEKGRGPLQGVAAGLTAVCETCDAAFLSSCDAPFLEANFVRRMIDLLGDYVIAVPETGGRRHPLAAVYRVDVLPIVEELLNANCLRIGTLLDRCPTRFVAADELADVDPDLHSLRNLNTPADYEKALRRFHENSD
jgi:molybdenum cofactor guanylyltransferase